MTFLHPLILVALVAIPVLIWWYAGQQRRRARAASAFAAPKLAASVAPHRPRWRRHVPMLVFNTKVTVLQSPTTDRSLVRSALAQLKVTGGTAIGDAIRTSLRTLTSTRKPGVKQPPAAIVLLSDGGSDVGSDPITAAQQAAADHIPIYTVVLGTAHGTVAEKRASGTVEVPVPPDPQQLAQIASVSHGKSFTATDAKGLTTVYQHLGAQLGHKKVKHEITATFAGGGLALLLIGGVASLAWFGRLV